MQFCIRPVIAAVVVMCCAAASGYGPRTTGIHAASGVRMPDRMAFVSRQSSVNHIYFMDVDTSGVGANPTRLTNDAEPENYPSWSPDGMRLVYQRDFNGSAIYLINADGTDRRRSAPHP